MQNFFKPSKVKIIVGIFFLILCANLFLNGLVTYTDRCLNIDPLTDLFMDNVSGCPGYSETKILNDVVNFGPVLVMSPASLLDFGFIPDELWLIVALCILVSWAYFISCVIIGLYRYCIKGRLRMVAAVGVIVFFFTYFLEYKRILSDQPVFDAGGKIVNDNFTSFSPSLSWLTAIPLAIGAMVLFAVITALHSKVINKDMEWWVKGGLVGSIVGFVGVLIQTVYISLNLIDPLNNFSLVTGISVPALSGYSLAPMFSDCVVNIKPDINTCTSSEYIPGFVVGTVLILSLYFLIGALIGKYRENLIVGHQTKL